jgi:hypothetical protein
MRRIATLLLIALVGTGCGSVAEKPNCAYTVRRAVEAQEAVKVCQAMIGCQIHLRDVIEVRELIVQAEACQKAKEAGL